MVAGLEDHRLCQLLCFSWNSTSVSRRKIVQLLLETCGDLELAPVGEQPEGLEIVLANDDPILGWIPSFSGDVISRCRRCGLQNPLGTRDGAQMVSSEPRSLEGVCLFVKRERESTDQNKMGTAIH